MGFCADIEGMRSYINDPHPNMGDINEKSFCRTKNICYNIIKDVRIRRNAFANKDSSNFLTVLNYHQISDSGYSSIHPIVPATPKENFRKQVRLLRDLEYSFISLKDLDTISSLPHKSCLITFDDGYKSVFEHALPIMKEENISGAIFITSSFIDSNRLTNYEKLVLLIHKVTSSNSDLIELFELYQKLVQRLDCAPFTGISIEKLRYHFRACLTEENRQKIIDDLCEAFFFSIEGSFIENLYLTWNELRKMSSHFEFGSHSANHPILGTLHNSRLSEEISTSKSLIEERLGNIKWFAYPFGYRSSFNSETIDRLKKHGFIGSFTSFPANNYLPIDDFFRICRFSISNESVEEFLFKIRG